ncbi:hypothetical protein CEXT_614861 [Caerostris extrusa]|uniref:Uncharacterized protein n=1 Tax=Caerostris extrusa TaxID=172846 RepID=A0AAV4WBI3_CAEEX|nr:hypothetical protein CEXT_614861 [Caerostris extrusa]
MIPEVLETVLEYVEIDPADSKQAEMLNYSSSKSLFDPVGARRPNSAKRIPRLPSKNKLTILNTRVTCFRIKKRVRALLPHPSVPSRDVLLFFVAS